MGRKGDRDGWCPYVCVYTRVDTRVCIHRHVYTQTHTGVYTDDTCVHVHTHLYSYTHVLRGCLVFHSCAHLLGVCVTWGKSSNLCPESSSL